MEAVKKHIYIAGIVAIFVIAVVSIFVGINQKKSQFGQAVRLENAQKIDWKKPKTDAQWAEDVKEESLHLKFGDQLSDMKQSHEAKLPHLLRDLREFQECPECVRWELGQRFKSDFDELGLEYNQKFEGKSVDEWVESEFQEASSTKVWEVEKLQQSIERINKEIELRKKGFVFVRPYVPAGDPERIAIDSRGSRVRSPLGTTYYIDADCGTPGNGTTATCNGDADDSFDELDDFTETARSAGDVAILRRGTTARYDNGTDLTFTSDGDEPNPITIEADYTDEWGDFASSSQTYAPIFGSKTMEASASITGIAANDWIFVQGDDQRLFAYEVDSVSGTTLTLYLPYKGNQSGSGNTLNVMPDAPIWNTAAGNFEWNIDADNYWKFQGIHVRGTDSQGNIELDSTYEHVFRDMILEGNGSPDSGIEGTDDAGFTYVYKSRFFNHSDSVADSSGSGARTWFIRDSLFDCNSVSTAAALGGNTFGTYYVDDSEETGCSEVTNTFTSASDVRYYLRNLIYDGTFNGNHTFGGNNQVFVEDENGVIGDNRLYGVRSAAASDFIVRSTTTPVRSGGGNYSIEVDVSSGEFTPNWETSSQLLFEYPIYHDTSSKQYDVYFKPQSTGDWGGDTSSDEMWIEFEAWGHASNNYRKITKSTGSLDFDGSSDWQALSVTVAPAQTGIGYLRAYAATSTGKFFVDVAPVIQ